MEIERKFLIKQLPEALSSYEHYHITQGYLSTDPVVRVREEGEDFVLTYKGKGLLAREEVNLPLTKESFRHLIQKADGRIIEKTRYRIPHGDYTIELDVFEGELAPLIMAEVEFPSVEEANSYVGPAWFDKDVTNDPAYHNSNMSKA
jgi:CYTH domain-containing protein